MSSVWIVHISHEHGDDCFAYSNPESARDGVWQFVRQWWEKNGPDEPMPEDHDEAISWYFDVNPEGYYAITELAVRD